MNLEVVALTDQGPEEDGVRGHPLSVAQKRIWSLLQIGRGDTLPWSRLVLHSRGPSDEAAVVEAIKRLLKRHGALRTRFRRYAGGFVAQYVDVEAIPPVEIVTLRSLSPERAAQEYDRFTSRRASFDPEQDLPIRIRLFDFGDHHLLVFLLHPIVCDAASLGFLASDFVAFYEGEAKARPVDLQAVPVDTRDHVSAEQDWIRSKAYRDAVCFWHEALGIERSEEEFVWAGFPTFMREQAEERRFESHAHVVAPRISRALALLAEHQGLPLAIVYHTIFDVLLFRYNSRGELSFAVVIENRSDWERQSGLFEDTIILETKLESSMSFVEALGRVRDALMEAVLHRIPFEKIQQDYFELAHDRPKAFVQAFHAHWEAPRTGSYDDSTWILEERRHCQAWRHSGIVLTTIERDDDVLVSVDFCEDLFDRRVVEDAAAHFATIAEAVAVDPHMRLRDIELIGQKELDRLSAPYQDEGVYDSRPIHELIAAVAQDHPDSLAILYQDEIWTFGELDRRANQLAHVLREVGVGAEKCVAVALRRSARAIMAILAVLKSGGAFIPVDPDHPVERNSHILTDAGVSVVLTRSEHKQKIPGCSGATVLELDMLDLESRPATAPAAAIGDAQLAYVIYTSGSTGRPKGVAVEHGPLTRHCQATARLYEMTAQSCELAFLPFSSDGGHERWMVPLAVGGRVVIPDGLWTPAQTFAAMRRYGVDNASFPTTYLQQLAEWAELSGEAPPIRLYSFGGEGLPQSTFDLLSRALEAQWLINGYGPTEAIMTPMVWKVAAGTRFHGMYAPIGRAVGSRRIYILDADLNPVPIGVTGELFIAGDGLARGYVGAHEKSERFLRDPFGAPEHRIYRTGDLARWLGDGTVEFVGRIDHQVKLRGFRIELGEIESAILAMPDVSECAVVLRRDTDNPTLVAYVVPSAGGDLDIQALRADLMRALPDYMLPSAFVCMAALPLNANSKLDRAALPPPGLFAEDLIPPETETETALAAIWRDVLGLARIGITQNFFEIGGHSMAALRILARIKQLRPRCSVGIADIFNHQDIRSLAAVIDQPRGIADGAEVIYLRGRGSRPMLYCLPGLLVSTREYIRLVDYLGPDQPAAGFLCYSLSEEKKLDASVEEITARYAEKIRRESKGKPCFLLGWSWGGLLAFEAARMLAEEIDLRLVIMVDVCDMDTDFAVGAIPSFRPGERDALQQAVEAWLVRAPMRKDWERLFAAMDSQAYTQFLRFVGNSEEDLPVDGPDIGSREHTFFVLIDNALIFRRYHMKPFDCPIHSWAAEDSLSRGLNLIDWRRYTPRAEAAEVVTGTTHLHIIGAPAFHERVAHRLNVEYAALRKS